MARILKQNWFLFGLVGICLITLADTTGTIAGMGNWIKSHSGADVVIFIIFVGSGLILKREQIRAGFRDIRGTVITIIIIFVVAPLVALIIAQIPINPSVKIGLFLIAVMPTTMSSGVVMTGAAGGNMAHSLLITVLASSLSVVTVPFSLAILVQSVDSVPMETAKMIMQMCLLVLLPLIIGLAFRPKRETLLSPIQKGIPVFNQCLILLMVWMGLSGAKGTVLSGGGQVLIIALLSVLFHAFLLAAAFASIHLFRIPRGRMESILFMGAQKTLTLPVLLQVKLFPQHGLALVFCVFHHFIHLMMDGYLVGILKKKKIVSIHKPTSDMESN